MLKTQKIISRLLDIALVFGSGALVDPNISGWLGAHQGVDTGVLVALALLRQLEKALVAPSA